AGVSGIRTRPFVVGTAIGEFPWVIAGVALGVSADRLARNDLSAVDPSLILALALVGLLLLAGPIYRTVRSTSHVTPSE
ncbi:TVP38/TMEM64 family protein, partial [Halorubrum tibetense]